MSGGIPALCGIAEHGNETLYAVCVVNVAAPQQRGIRFGGQPDQGLGIDVRARMGLYDGPGQIADAKARLDSCMVMGVS